MTTATTTTNAAANLAGKFWATRGGLVASFESSRPGFGVMRADGCFISGDGVSPCVWRTKRQAEAVAPYADEFAGHVWVRVFNSREGAEKKF